VLTAAASFLDACGSLRLRDEAERELGRLGKRPYRRTSRGSAPGGLASLTAREREIADLVVDRLTNPEIAQRMFLSTKSVETHLRNTFRKRHLLANPARSPPSTSQARSARRSRGSVTRPSSTRL
jgi:DNA-binding CsgD family transcriptional regulator